MADRFIEIFSANLKRYLDEYELSQAELARRLKVSNTAVNSWVKGYKVPRMDKVDAMCEIFNCSREDLMTEHNTVVEEQLYRMAKYAVMLHDLERLNETHREMARKYIQWLLYDQEGNDGEGGKE